MIIFVRLEQEIIECEVNPDDTLWELKTFIWVLTGLYPDEQNLYLNGRNLSDNDRTLEDYRIKRESTINNYPRMFDFCAHITDVTKEEALDMNDRSEKSPKWRQAKKGLCLEGVCRNVSCPAQHVIMNMGFGRFDFFSSELWKLCKCPLCEELAIPTTCGFKNCWWKFEGQQYKTIRETETVSGNWKMANNTYHFFDKEQSDKSSYDGLIFWVGSYTHGPFREEIQKHVKANPQIYRKIFF